MDIKRIVRVSDREYKEDKQRQINIEALRVRDRETDPNGSKYE